MDKSLLSICIPTYNRRDVLRICLERICRLNEDKIPVVICDNGSTDGTEEMVRELFDLDYIFYYNNGENLGIDRNYIRIIEEGKKISNYSLWLGSDDNVYERFFDGEILETLSQYRPDFVLLNSLITHIEENGEIYGEVYIPDLVEGTDLIVKDLKLFYDLFALKMPFGTMIVNNEKILTDNLERHIGTWHLYTGAILDYLTDIYRCEGRIKAIITGQHYINQGIVDKSYKDSMKEVCRGIGKSFAVLPDELKDLGAQKLNSLAQEGIYGANTGDMLASYFENKK